VSPWWDLERHKITMPFKEHEHRPGQAAEGCG
jgi:hypothetical protein